MGQTPYTAEIAIYPYNFAPKTWAVCDGQLLSVGQNPALFTILGTAYGGDGMTTFALPNLQGAVPIGLGQGPGLSLYNWGKTGGSQTVELLVSEIPAHNHAINASNSDATDQTPVGQLMANDTGGVTAFGAVPATVQMNANSLTTYGGGGAHNNMMPFLTLTYCIALAGVFPDRAG